MNKIPGFIVEVFSLNIACPLIGDLIYTEYPHLMFATFPILFLVARLRLNIDKHLSFRGLCMSNAVNYA